MNRIPLRSGAVLSAIGYAEQPRRRDPADAPSDDEHLFYPPRQRSEMIEEALGAGMTTVLLTHERDVLTFVEACAAGRIDRSRYTAVTTDGAVLERCGDTESDAERLIAGAIARKKRLLGTDRLDVFALLDFNAAVHTETMLAGAAGALNTALASGEISEMALMSFRDWDYAAEVIARKLLPIGLAIGSYNSLDRSAGARLLPECIAANIPFFAVQTYNWLAGVPFVRFPNTWRLRNMTQNFFGMSAGEAHLRWLLGQRGVSGALIAQDEPGQASQNTAVFSNEGLLEPPPDIEALLREFADALTGTADGWKKLLDDERWEYRYAAEQVLIANNLLP